MNERIKLLAEQAGAKIYTEQTRSGDTVDFLQYAGFDLEKFAELIVRECSDIVEGDIDVPWEVSGRIIKKIKQHFGVEE